MPHRTILDTIRRLDPETDHHRIVYLDSYHEFPWDTVRSLEFALFRTYAVPSIGRLLAQTGEFTQRTQQRYDDTDLILSEITENGYNTARGRGALRNMNRQHGQYPISNNDFRYVLSTFIFEPIRWNARFGWRQMIEQEKLAAFYYWRAIGQHMNIKDIPPTYEAYDEYNRTYEREHFRYTPEGGRVARATRDLFLGWFLPEAVRFLGRPAFYAALDESLLTAFRFPRPPTALRRLVEASLRARGRLVRQLPERRVPKLRTQRRIASYPHGYLIESLGRPPG